MSESLIRIGLVEDNPLDVELLRTMLAEPPELLCELHHSSRLQEALVLLETKTFDIMLLDLGLPDCKGLETFHQVKSRAPNLPVIIFSGYGEKELAIQAVAEGAQDYLVKGQTSAYTIKRAIFYAIERQRATHEKLVRATFSAAATGIATIKADGEFILINPAYCKMVGYSETELHALNFYTLIHHDDRTRSLELAGQLFAGKIDGFSVEERYVKKDGSKVWIRASVSLERSANGQPLNIICISEDISRRKAAEEEAEHLAFYDSLTGLANRPLLIVRLQQALISSARNRHMGALLFIDLDNFKTLNDSLGHGMGDLLLQQVAQRLVSCVRESDTVARWSGDEFVVMLEGISKVQQEAAAQAETVGEKILASFAQPFQLVDFKHYNTSSIGVTMFNDQVNSPDELLKQADIAMYQAKASGRNTMRFFDHEMQAVISARAVLEADLHEALQRNEFLLHYQPQIDSEGRIIGAEALVRWQHPKLGLVPPIKFIPVAEDTGMILNLGHWVLETACAQLATWATRPETAELRLSVNVSARQFRHPDLVDQVLAVIDYTGCNPQLLKLELTESLLADNIEDVIAKMIALKAKGVGFSMDDFGTGYSSLTYLKRLPLDQLKIDRSFVRDVLTNLHDAAIARTIVALGQGLDMMVIAEGVETEEQRDFLAQYGCNVYQGYLFSRPLPIDQFEEFVQARKKTVKKTKAKTKK